MIDGPEKLLAKATELKDRAEEVRTRAEAITDEELRKQMLRMAASYERMAAELMEKALKR